jgi:hypothetical protein
MFARSVGILGAFEPQDKPPPLCSLTFKLAGDFLLICWSRLFSRYILIGISEVIILTQFHGFILRVGWFSLGMLVGRSVGFGNGSVIGEAV